MCGSRLYIDQDGFSGISTGMKSSCTSVARPRAFSPDLLAPLFYSQRDRDSRMRQQ
jgi:hypothetical protein